MPLYPPTDPLRSGYLPELDGHKVFWQTYGNARGPAIVLLHGGPGGGTQDNLHRLFDPDHWHIITTDQRGSGRSMPHAGDTTDALIANTTDHLVQDLERLRQVCGVERWFVYGGSWGSTLAQAYAQAHLNRVLGLILCAVTTTSQAELDFLCGGAGQFLPEAFDRFRSGAPDGTPGVAMAEAYYHLLTSDDPEVAAAAAMDWCTWEEAVLLVDPRAKPGGRFKDPRFRLGFARVVTHYFRKLAWLEPPLLDRAGRLSDLPAVLINSRLDLSCPLSTAWALHRSMPWSELTIIPGSLHGSLTGPLSDAVIAADQTFQHQGG